MKITVCAICGSQDIERLAWVTLRSKQMVEFVDDNDFEFPINYCNNCGDRSEVIDLEYLEKYGSAYKIVGGNDPYLVYYPGFKDGASVQMDEVVVEIGDAFDEKERRIFFDDMLKLFPDKRADIIYIFRPYIDMVKEFVTEKTEVVIDILFREAHEQFRTESGDIEPMQELRLDRIKTDLIDLVTQQVKQNMPHATTV